MRTINIAFTATPDWFRYTAVAAFSVLYHANKEDKYNFYIVSNSFSEEDKEYFRVLDKVKPSDWNFITVDDKDYEAITHNWLGCVSCYRIRFSSLIDVDKLLFLDSDLLALNDIAELYDYDVTDYYLAAVEDKMYDMRYTVKLEDDEIYYNGGVQLINLNMLRKEDMEQKFVERLMEKGGYTDQDVINDLCRKKILSLPLKFNVVNYPPGFKHRLEEYQQALSEPVIFHYTPVKPWINRYVKYSEKWFNYKKLYEKLEAES